MALPYVQILVCAIASMAVGFIWYAPPVFGNMWMKWTGLDPKKMESGKKKMPVMMIVQFIFAVVLATIMSMMLTETAVATVTEGLSLGFWLWLGFVTTVLIGSVLWEGKPVKLFVLNSAYHLVN